MFELLILNEVYIKKAVNLLFTDYQRSFYDLVFSKENYTVYYYNVRILNICCIFLN